MPDKFLTHLLYACGATFLTYVVFMVVTISFATIQTDLSADVREREASLVGLEAQYYDAISELSKVDPVELGYVTPKRVEYVAADGKPTFSRADQ